MSSGSEPPIPPRAHGVAPSAAASIQDMFAAAREEAPPELVREEVWGRIASTTSLPGAPAGALAAASSKAAVIKLVGIGALVGAGSAAATLVALGAGVASIDDLQAPTARPARSAAVIASGESARLAESPPRARAAPPRIDAVASIQAPAPTPPEREDVGSSLAAEARLVTDARRALVRGDAAEALGRIRQTHALTRRALEPEELALEARALRMLGRADEALAAELVLRRRFPTHALAR